MKGMKLMNEIESDAKGKIVKILVDESTPVEYQINTKNLENFLDIPPTDDSYYANINGTLPVGTSNGLAYVNDGYGVVLKI